MPASITWTLPRLLESIFMRDYVFQPLFRYLIFLRPTSVWADWANFRLMGVCLRWEVILKFAEVATKLYIKLYILFDHKNGWATFWATFPQTYLVTLANIII
jgi:hypothetical protein